MTIPLGLLLIVALASWSWAGGYASMRVADLPDYDTIERVVEIETKYLGLDANSGDKLLQPSETLQRLHQLLNDFRAQLDDGIERRAKVAKRLIEFSRPTPEDDDEDDDESSTCDEVDIYEPAIWSRMLAEARNVATYLKFQASIRVGQCAAIALSKAVGELKLDTWTELRQLMGFVYRELPQDGKEVPSQTSLAEGVVEYMRQKKALPASAGMPIERFGEQFRATVEPICKSFNQALGAAVGVFGHYAKSDLSAQMSKKNLALLNFYEVCSRARAYWPQAYEVFNELPPARTAVTTANESPAQPLLLLPPPTSTSAASELSLEPEIQATLKSAPSYKKASPYKRTVRKYRAKSTCPKRDSSCK